MSYLDNDMRKLIGRKDTCKKFLKHLYYETANFEDKIINVSRQVLCFSKIEMQRCRGCDVAISLRGSSRNYFAQCLFEKLSLELPFFTQVHFLCDLTSHFRQKRKKPKNIHTKSNCPKEWTINKRIVWTKNKLFYSCRYSKVLE